MSGKQHKKMRRLIARATIGMPQTIYRTTENGLTQVLIRNCSRRLLKNLKTAFKTGQVTSEDL